MPVKCLKSVKDQCALTERERDGERSDSETLSVLLMQSILLLFIPLTAPACVFCPSRLPNSFHLLDLDLTWSQTACSDKATERLCSSKGALFYRRQDRDTVFLAVFLARTTGNAVSNCLYSLDVRSTFLIRLNESSNRTFHVRLALVSPCGVLKSSFAQK